jgi:hypothetical protein
MQPQPTNKQTFDPSAPATPEERRVDRELRRHVRHGGPEVRAALLIIARELTQSGSINELLFQAGAI